MWSRIVLFSVKRIVTFEMVFNVTHLVIEGPCARVVIVNFAVRLAPTLGVRHSKILKTNNHFWNISPGYETSRLLSAQASSAIQFTQSSRSEPQSHHWVASPLCVAKVNIPILWRKFTQLNLTSKQGLYTSLFEQQTPPNEVIHESWNTHNQLKSKFKLFWTSEPGHTSCTE